MAHLSVIVPVFNEAAGIVAALTALSPLRQHGVEVIVADGGSQDDTVALATPLADQVIAAPRGRAAQMNAGAAQATGNMLLFLHADTQLPTDADTLIAKSMQQFGGAWGRFDVHIDGTHFMLPLVAAMMNARSRLTGIATGDQAMFVARDVFVKAEGFPDIPLMEDLVLSKRLKQIGPPLCLRARVTTSGRRWERHGVIRTILLMWRLRFAFWRGADPTDLARQYGYAPQQ